MLLLMRPAFKENSDSCLTDPRTNHNNTNEKQRARPILGDEVILGNVQGRHKNYESSVMVLAVL